MTFKVTHALYMYQLKDRIVRYKKALIKCQNASMSSRLFKWIKRLEQSYNWINAGGDPGRGEIVRLFGKDAVYVKETNLMHTKITPVLENINYGIVIERQFKTFTSTYSVDFSTTLPHSECKNMIAEDVISITPFSWIEIFKDEAGDYWMTATGDPYLYKTTKTPF